MVFLTQIKFQVFSLDVRVHTVLKKFSLQDEILPIVQSSNLTLSFSSESSIEEELKRESTADVITILVSLGRFAY